MYKFIYFHGNQQFVNIRAVKFLLMASKFTPLLLHKVLETTVSCFGDHYALNFLGRRFTYRELGDLVEKAAAGLQNMGVQKDTRVMLLLPNGPDYIVFFYAILKAGGVVVNANPLYSSEEIKALLQDSGAQYAVTLDLKNLSDKILDIFEETQLKKVVICSFRDELPFPKNWLFPLVHYGQANPLPSHNSKRQISGRSIVNSDAKFRHVKVDVDDIALLQYTGGTTGLPKAAMLSHKNLSINAQQCASWFPDAEDGAERMLAVLPFFHVFAMTTVLNFSVLKGFEIIALPQFDMKQMIKTIRETRPTLFPAVPTLYGALAKLVSQRPGIVDLSSIKYCISGGAPLPLEVHQAFSQASGANLVEGYGLTETSPVLSANPLAGINKVGSIGLAFPETEIAFLSLEEPYHLLEEGETGELVVKGPQVMRGYWNRAEENQSIFWEGWLRTGDIGYRDSDGYMYIVDRLKDMAIVNGYNVYPRHVEAATYKHEAVEECIAAGVPDSVKGEAIKLWVKPFEGKPLVEADLRQFLQERLAPYEVPRDIIIRATPLPRTPIGKLSRKDVLAETHT